jgi:hypothetical protein
VIIVGYPTRRRIYLHFFFGWHVIPNKLPSGESHRIRSRLIEHFHRLGKTATMFKMADKTAQAFTFSPMLFEEKARASTILEEAGFIWMNNYSSLEILHDKYGLEVCGIRDELDVKPIADAMQKGFPQWHYHHISAKNYGLEPGWAFSIFMLSGCCGDEKCEA